MQLYLIRHGQSVNNALMEDQLLRVHDPELTDIGLQQAEKVAEYLASPANVDELVRYRLDAPERQTGQPFGLTHLYSSAMYRALQTARPIGRALGLKVQVWLDIHEHGGIYLTKDGVTTGYPGRGRTEILTEFDDYVLPETITDTGWWRPEDGEEPLAKCQGRALLVAGQLRNRAMDEASRHDRIGLVTHGTFMDALIKAFMGNLPGRGVFYAHYNTAITRLDIFPDDETRLRFHNRIHHLPPDLLTV